MTAPNEALTTWDMVKAAALLFVLWTLFGLLSSAHFFFGYEGATDAASFLALADNVIVFYWGWAILTPAVIFIGRRAARNGMPRAREWIMLALAGVGMVIVHGLVHQALVVALGVSHKPGGAGFLRDYVIRHGGGDLATFFVLIGVWLLKEANRRARSRELAAAALESRLARADLELLRWHLHPHFLFNALNTVSTLVLKGQADAAEKAISLIARYLRSALAQRADTTVSLSDELATVKRYVEIETLRFGDSLRFETVVQGESLEARVPGLIIQPIVENAIGHGIARRPGADPIRINVSIHGSRLRLTVTNPNDAGPEDNAGSHHPRGGSTNGVPVNGDEYASRFGIRYVRERLRQFYGSDARFDLSIGPGETSATLDLPFSTAYSDGDAARTDRIMEDRVS